MMFVTLSVQWASFFHARGLPETLSRSSVGGNAWGAPSVNEHGFLSLGNRNIDFEASGIVFMIPNHVGCFEVQIAIPTVWEFDGEVACNIAVTTVLGSSRNLRPR